MLLVQELHLLQSTLLAPSGGDLVHATDAGSGVLMSLLLIIGLKMDLVFIPRLMLVLIK